MPEVKPGDFFTDTPPQQIIGSETEYDVQFPPHYERTDEDELLSLFLQQELIDQIGLKASRNVYDFAEGGKIAMVSDIFLSNGSRLYLDMDHLEYCTPESLGPRQAAATDAAGAIVLNRLVANSDFENTKVYRRTGIAGSPERESSSQTSGHHENFLIPASLSRIANHHIPTFLATRFWTWGGIVRDQFGASQKISGIGVATSQSASGSTSEGGKPMFAIKKADQDADINSDPVWSRLEIRFADSTHMPHTKYLSYAASSLMLRLCAHNDMVPELDRYRIADDAVVDAAKLIASDLSMNALVTTITGARVSALDIQEHYVEMFEKIDELIKLPEDERTAIPALRKLIDDMRRVQADADDLSLVADRVEWAARYRYISRKLGESAVTIHNPVAEALDLLWDRCGDGYGPRYVEVLRGRSGVAKIGPDHEMIEEHIYNPPTLTRANLRAQLVEEGSVLFDWLTWSKAKYHALGGFDNLVQRHSLSEVSWPNPYQFQ